MELPVLCVLHAEAPLPIGYKPDKWKEYDAKAFFTSTNINQEMEPMVIPGIIRLVRHERAYQTAQSEPEDCYLLLVNNRAGSNSSILLDIILRDTFTGIKRFGPDSWLRRRTDTLRPIDNFVGPKIQQALDNLKSNPRHFWLISSSIPIGAGTDVNSGEKLRFVEKIIREEPESRQDGTFRAFGLRDFDFDELGYL
jgi:hypothetical protein